MKTGDPLLDATINTLNMIDKAMSDTMKPITPVVCISKSGIRKLAESGVTPEQAVVQDLDVARYIAAGGCECIKCKSGDIEGGFVEIIEGGAFQNITCNACGASWTDEYELTGISHFTVGVESTDGGQTIEP